MVSMSLALVIVAPDQARQDAPRAYLALLVSVVVGFGVFALGSRTIEHKKVDWRGLFRVGYTESYEYLAALAALVIAVVSTVVLSIVLGGSGILVPIVGGGCIGNIVRSLLFAWGRATQVPQSPTPNDPEQPDPAR